ncbi:putative oxidoreductase YdgJ [compost metagenome]
MNTILNTGLLAYGMSGKVFHAPFVEAHPGFNLRAVTERSRKMAQADYPQVISYPDIESCLSDTAIDLIIVNTPNFTHYEYARKALIAGKHVLVEKPFTATTKQAVELFALARETGKKIMVYQNRRYDSGFKATRKVIESGALGRLVEVHFRFDRYRPEIGPKSFKEDPAYEANGLLYDLGPHLIDQAIALFGKPLAFHKTLARHREQTRVDDYFAIHLSYPEDLNVFLTASLLVADTGDAFVLNGTQGSFRKNHADVQESQLLKGIKPTAPEYGIELPEDAGRLTVATPGGLQKTITSSEKGDYMGLFEAVYQHLAHDAPFPVSEEDILTQLSILEAANK